MNPRLNQGVTMSVPVRRNAALLRIFQIRSSSHEAKSNAAIDTAMSGVATEIRQTEQSLSFHEKLV